ncbi:aldehyde dehydrogenase family protein, partial [Escherichia coli]|uniref:aldehyde dehydrogenase family protein n=1 Tax=Escherichia coli TaxID=562 RepID=UPI001C5A6859
IAAGCAMISKPAAETPLSALALAVLAEHAGLPAGLFNIILSADSSSIGKEFTENEKVRKLTFTGSTNVGKILMRQGADQIMKLGLELGGNAPFIVF